MSTSSNVTIAVVLIVLLLLAVICGAIFSHWYLRRKTENVRGAAQAAAAADAADAADAAGA